MIVPISCYIEGETLIYSDYSLIQMQHRHPAPFRLHSRNTVIFLRIERPRSVAQPKGAERRRKSSRTSRIRTDFPWNVGALREATNPDCSAPYKERLGRSLRLRREV